VIKANPVKDNRAANAALRAMTACAHWAPGGNRPATPERILVVRLGNVGDMVVALPAFHALRRLFPAAHIALLTSPTKRGAPGAPEVLANDATFDDTVVYYEDQSAQPYFLKTLAKTLRSGRFDTVVALPNHLSRFGSLVKFVGLGVAIGARRFVGFTLVTPRDFERAQVDRLVELVSDLGPAAIEPFPWLMPSEEARQRAATLLAPAGNRPIVGMHCGAKRPANQWPVTRFAEVAQRLVEETDAFIVLTGSAGERELADSVAARLGERCVNLAGQTTIDEAAAVAEKCCVVLTNDTGMMHVAYAVGTRVVAVFGGRFYPHIWYPYGEGHVVIRKDIECSPCHRDVCPLYAVPRCLELISAAEVYAAVRPFLKH
jgi:lipopolysaccharide heptosyltransferase II